MARSTPILISLFLGLAMAPMALAQGAEVATLAAMRSQLATPPLTTQERQVVARQAVVLLKDLYVHRHEKPEFYPGLEDASVALQAWIQQAEKKSPQEFEDGVRRIFNAQRDLHLDFRYASPQNAYIGFLPLTFARTATPASFFEVRVSAVQKDFFAKFAPGQRIPALGDQVVAYDGRPVNQVICEMQPIVQGANTYGWFARSVQSLAWKHHKRQALPAKDSVKITFKAYVPEGDRQEHYTIELPWLIQRDAAVKRSHPGEMNFKDKLRLAMDDLQETYRQFLRENALEPRSIYPSQPTSDSELTWGKLQNEQGCFGYLRLNSFLPSTSTDNVIGEIHNLLTGELADTQGLILDLRGNPGGNIELADKLVQLFAKTEARPLTFRLLNNALNYRLFFETPLGAMEERFKALIDAAKGNGQTYTAAISFTTQSQANKIGQAYYKPVALLTNACCYSAGDMLTCGMQDNEAAEIFGEDPRTGAGGANVMEHSDFVKVGLKDVFSPLPGGRGMRVSWRQTLRVGEDNAGDQIEDFGCLADVDASLTPGDLVNGCASQAEKITGHLAETAEGYQAAVRPEGRLSYLYLAGQASAYTVYVKETPKVAIHVNGKLEKEVDSNANEAEVPVSWTMKDKAAAGKPQEVTFVGLSETNEPLWNLKRHILVLNEKVVVKKEGFAIDFAKVKSLSPFQVISPGMPDKSGWHLAPPFLQVGYHPNYPDNAETDAALMTDLLALTQARLEFGMEYATEMHCDFIEVFIMDNTRKKNLLRASGTKPMARYSFDISEFAGKDKVSVHFKFTSDTNTTDLGVRISDVTIR